MAAYLLYQLTIWKLNFTIYYYEEFKQKRKSIS